ncbi:putative tonB-independent protein-uptake protein [Sulfurimonas denitrificans DSM 1251]|uniref:Putative tonB-independent protein-uptake protein n=1 Tax=Sulfurimonas denitrificans (strain ATCC 33889 / DSM 1251) TaxID=326298 RepID=Q30QQ6_SULDN|nr:Tol-Pal system protein TolB [Sulfurimonas denitrificans]ABB44675.1 putative tonB-independent protein-uptake protein [Sulfurimonas denitrificans DSM 1251]
MKIIVSILFVIVSMFANDATIDVVKKADTLPSIALEDASVSYDSTFKAKFFKTVVADLNVLSIFNVDKVQRDVNFDASSVLVENKNMNYVLRYKLSQDDNSALNVDIKLFNKEGSIVFNKNYKVNSSDIYMFVAHTIAYDINSFMGESPIEWIKRKVIFSRMLSPQRSELVVTDYTLTYQHVIVKGGFNLFPKWANKEQSAFYYTSLNETKPTLKYLDLKTGKSKVIKSSDGMMICSDINEDGSKLLFTMAPNGQPDIFLYDIKTQNTKKLTNYGGIDVGGQFMGDDSVIFVSDRLGYPNVFSLNIKSGSVEQIVYYGKSNSACSVHGKYVVYKARESSDSFSNNTFNLHLVSMESDFVRRLTAVGVNEFPKFSVDGDAVIFVKNYQSQSSVGIIRLNHNKNYLFPLQFGKIQSIDW